jgi:hypothetical protein
MGTVNIRRYEFTTAGILEDFEEVIHTAAFKYDTRHLALSGLEPQEIMKAISRAMKVCRLNGIDPAEHFRSLYIFDEDNHNTYCDWRMTRQGFALVVINTPATNPAIASWQWQLINSVMPMQ